MASSNRCKITTAHTGGPNMTDAPRPLNSLKAVETPKNPKFEFIATSDVFYDLPASSCGFASTSSLGVRFTPLPPRCAGSATSIPTKTDFLTQASNKAANDEFRAPPPSSARSHDIYCRQQAYNIANSLRQYQSPINTQAQNGRQISVINRFPQSHNAYDHDSMPQTLCKIMQRSLKLPMQCASDARKASLFSTQAPGSFPMHIEAQQASYAHSAPSKYQAPVQSVLSNSSDSSASCIQLHTLQHQQPTRLQDRAATRTAALPRNRADAPLDPQTGTSRHSQNHKPPYHPSQSANFPRGSQFVPPIREAYPRPLESERQLYSTPPMHVTRSPNEHKSTLRSADLNPSIISNALETRRLPPDVHVKFASEVNQCYTSNQATVNQKAESKTASADASNFMPSAACNTGVYHQSISLASRQTDGSLGSSHYNNKTEKMASNLPAVLPAERALAENEVSRTSQNSSCNFPPSAPDSLKQSVAELASNRSITVRPSLNYPSPNGKKQNASKELESSPPAAALAKRIAAVNQWRQLISPADHYKSYGWIRIDSDRIKALLKSTKNDKSSSNLEEPAQFQERGKDYFALLGKGLKVNSILYGEGCLYISRETLQRTINQQPIHLDIANAMSKVLVHSRLAMHSLQNPMNPSVFNKLAQNALDEDQRYIEKRRIQNSIRALSEHLEGFAPCPSLLSICSAIYSSEGIAKGIIHSQFDDALASMSLWPPEFTDVDKEEIFMALCLPDFNLSNSTSSSPTLSATVFIKGLLFVPYNLPDYPVPLNVTRNYETPSHPGETPLYSMPERCPTPTQSVDFISYCHVALLVCEAMEIIDSTALRISPGTLHQPVHRRTRPFGALWNQLTVDWEVQKSTYRQRHSKDRANNELILPFWHTVQDFLNSRLVSLEELQVVLKELHPIKCLQSAVQLIAGTATAVLTPLEWNALLFSMNQPYVQWKEDEIVQRYDERFQSDGASPAEAVVSPSNDIEASIGSPISTSCIPNFEHFMGILHSSVTFEAIQRLTTFQLPSNKTIGPFHIHVLLHCCNLFIHIFRKSKCFKEVRKMVEIK